jgi:hypothetical protein
MVNIFTKQNITEDFDESAADEKRSALRTPA